MLVVQDYYMLVLYGTGARNEHAHPNMSGMVIANMQ